MVPATVVFLLAARGCTNQVEEDMGLPRKGTRAIAVDGRRYRWLAVYADVTWCSAACPLRLTVQQDGGRGQLLIAHFNGEAVIEGATWVFPRYGSELTPGVVADIIRAGIAAGWEPGVTQRPPVVLDGEPFLRLPEDPEQAAVRFRRRPEAAFLIGPW